MGKSFDSTDFSRELLDSVVVQTQRGQLGELANDRRQGFEKVKREFEFGKSSQVSDRVWEARQRVLGEVQEGQVSEVSNLDRDAA